MSRAEDQHAELRGRLPEHIAESVSAGLLQLGIDGPVRRYNEATDLAALDDELLAAALTIATRERDAAQAAGHDPEWLRWHHNAQRGVDVITRAIAIREIRT